MQKLNKTQGLYIFLLLQPVIDLITSIMTRFLNFPITLGIVTRGLFLLILVIYTIFFTKGKYWRNTLIYLAAICLFIILYFVTKPDIFNTSFLIQEIINLFKYFYFPVALVCMFNCYNYLKLDNRKIESIFIINVVVFALLIIIPEVLNISFNSYHGINNGTVGWFYAANEIGAILTLLFPYLYRLGYQKRYFKLIIFTLILVIAMMMIGTKVAFLGMILTEIAFCIYFIISRKKITLMPFVVSLFILIISIIVIPSLPAIGNLKNNIDKANVQTIDEELKNNEQYQRNQNTSFGKFLKVALSSRDIYLYNTIDIYKDSSLVDKFFGIGFVNRDKINNPKIEKLVEIDAFDILFHYGIVGFILYISLIFWIYFKSLFQVIKRKFKLTFYELLYLYSITLLIGISCLAGHICGAPSVSIYLIFSLVMLYNEINNKKEKKDS